MLQSKGPWACAICGRTTWKPTILIGEEAIGPVCARRAGLIKAAKSSGNGTRFRLFSALRSPRGVPAATTGDLFDGIDDA